MPLSAKNAANGSATKFKEIQGSERKLSHNGFFESISMPCNSINPGYYLLINQTFLQLFLHQLFAFLFPYTAMILKSFLPLIASSNTFRSIRFAQKTARASSENWCFATKQLLIEEIFEIFRLRDDYVVIESHAITYLGATITSEYETRKFYQTTYYIKTAASMNHRACKSQVMSFSEDMAKWKIITSRTTE